MSRNYRNTPDKRTLGRPYYLGVCLNCEELEFLIGITKAHDTTRAEYIRTLIHREMERRTDNE